MVGSSMTGIGTPFGSFQVGDYSYSIYRLVLFASALGVLGGLYMLFNEDPLRRARPRDDPGCRTWQRRSASIQD